MQLSKIKIGVLVVLLLFGIGCAQKVAVRRSAEVPAAQAEAKITRTDNNNTRIELEVQHLAPPQNLTPKKSVYVVWAQAPQGRTINLGQMIVGEDRASEFVGITPLYEFRILVTAEEQSTATTSGVVDRCLQGVVTGRKKNSMTPSAVPRDRPFLCLMPIDFECNLAAAPLPLAHAWEHTVGSGRALLALRADWREQLRRAHFDLGFRHVRFHAMLDDDMGTLICQNEKLLYSFFNIDSIFDYLLAIGMQPFAELSFMPATLASGDTTVFRFQGNVTPPRDYQQWGALIDKLVRHWVERYGAREVGQWCLEVWNEPNLKAFWTGGKKGYYELYRATAQAIKNIDPALKVGGPSSAQNAWIPEFLDHCDKHQLPVDFLTTHYYPTDAFGKIGADTLTQLEHAPRDVMRQRAEERILKRAVCRCTTPNGT